VSSIIGIWLYASLIYQGHPVARPDPALQMYFTFESDSVNEIFYYRTGETGFCKRRASYRVEQDEIIQTVISVDENNADFCGQDSDMQLGQTSKVKYQIVDNDLWLYLPLGDETLIYVWSRSALQ
jgi:hypothetical protein